MTMTLSKKWLIVALALILALGSVGFAPEAQAISRKKFKKLLKWAGGNVKDVSKTVLLEEKVQKAMAIFEEEKALYDKAFEHASEQAKDRMEQAIDHAVQGVVRITQTQTDIHNREVAKEFQVLPGACGAAVASAAAEAASCQQSALVATQAKATAGVNLPSVGGGKPEVMTAEVRRRLILEEFNRHWE